MLVCHPDYRYFADKLSQGQVNNFISGCCNERYFELLSGFVDLDLLVVDNF